MKKEIKGILEIDADRGVIYFHSNTGRTVLRICQLPKPIPVRKGVEELLDITYIGCSWGK